MGWTERIMAIVAVLVAAVAIGVLIQYEPGPDPGVGPVHLTVEGPDGEIWNGTIQSDRDTAFTALIQASQKGGFSVEWTGSGETRFVTSIAGYENDGAAGWCYAVWHGEWTYPAISSDAYGLWEGQRVLWRYHQDGCPLGGEPSPKAD